MQKANEDLKSRICFYINDDEFQIRGEKKLLELMQKAADENFPERETLEVFIRQSEIQRNKVLSYCVDFRDPTDEVQTVKQNGKVILLNSFLREDEIAKLYHFVEKHKNDLSFGEVVYKIMNNHKMTPPQVYHGVLMRRQDFARVTDFRCKNVSRKLAWQIVIGLHCSLEEADIVLFSAGYIRRNTKLDLTMQYFIEHGNYDIEAIDSVLADLGLATFTY